ncbi:MAG: WG repeat-containing protein [Parabacteroides sp.]
MKRQCLNLMVLALITLLSACDKSSSYQVTHLPFKADEDSRWGLIDFKGNPLIEDEFEEQPSPVVEDRFYVKNADGLYEFYTAEKKFKKIGGEYIRVGIFHDGLAPVVEKDQPISYIRPDGSVAFTLDRYNDELIVQATVFQEGRAAFETKSGKWGYIDNTGKVVIEPKYDFASLFWDKNAIVLTTNKEWSLISIEGKELFKPKEDDQIISLPWQGSIIYSEERNGDNYYGLLDQKGEKVIKASTKYGGLLHAYRNMFVFNDSHYKCGLIDRKGTVLIRAKYDGLIPTEDVLIFKENDKYGLLSYEGEKICSAIYEYIIPFVDNQDYTYVLEGNDWILIDKKGTDVRKGEYNRITYDYCIINKRSIIESSAKPYLHHSTLMVQSDYLDVQAEVDDMLTVIHNDGSLDKLSYNTKSNEFAQLYDKDYKVNDLKDQSSMGTLTKIADLYKTWVIANFNGTVITPNYKRVWKDSYWGSGHWENEIDGYSYNDDARIEKFILHIELQGKFINRKEEVHQAIHNWFEARGYTFASKETADDVLSSYWIKNTPSVHAGIHYYNDNNYFRIAISK